jgi:hypothetical protein
MNDILSRLERLPPSKWDLHETVLCQELCLKANEGASVRTQLWQLLQALKVGDSGQKRNN